MEGGPALIRKQNLIPSLERIGWHVKDYGDLEFTAQPQDAIALGIKNPKTVGKAMHKV